MQRKICLLLIFLNEVHRLGECLAALDRAIEKSVHQVEIVAIDSGSNDGSLRHFRHRSNSVYRLEGPASPSVGAALYLGFGLIDQDYDYAQYIEVDSELDDSWLDAAVSALDNAESAVAGVKGFWASKSDGANSAAQRRRSGNTGGGIGGPALMTVSVLKEFPYNPYLPGYADIDHSIRLEASDLRVERIDRPMLYSSEGQMGYLGLLRKVYRRYSVGAGMSLRHGWRTPRVRSLLLRRLWRQSAVIVVAGFGSLTLVGGLVLWPQTTLVVALIVVLATASWAAIGGRRRVETIGLWLARTLGLLVGATRRPLPFDGYESNLVEIRCESGQ